MVVENAREISNSLKKKFLYENDINSIHILINLYEANENLRNIFPKYMSLCKLRKIIGQQIRGRQGIDLASKNIADLIHDDFTRFELLLYLEGFKKGNITCKYVDEIEKIILSTSEIGQIYSKSFIKEKIKNNHEINALKEEAYNKIKNELINNESYKIFIGNFNKKIIKPKLFSINRKLDKQLKIDEDGQGKPVIKFESKMFSKKELSKLYKKLVLLVYDDGLNVLLEGYWSGLVERVLRRYK